VGISTWFVELPWTHIYGCFRSIGYRHSRKRVASNLRPAVRGRIVCGQSKRKPWNWAWAWRVLRRYLDHTDLGFVYWPERHILRSGVGSTSGTVYLTDGFGCGANVQGTNTVKPYVQISSITYSPTTISAMSGMTEVTVLIYVPVIPATDQTVTVSLATYSASPTNNNVSYQAAQVVPIGPGTVSPKSVTFKVNSSALSQQGSVVTASNLSNASAGLTIVPATPPSPPQPRLTWLP
jgi:hypothetical protein